MVEFQEGTLDTLMERLCSCISGFDPEWVRRCIPATEEQIRQLNDILAEYTGYSIKFCCNDDKLWERIKYSLSSFPEFFACLSPLGNGRDGKDGDDIYAERYAGFNRYGDISKFITDPDLLQVTWDECVYISKENDYDIAVDLETCYAPFDEVKPFIAFLATQICELDNVAQRFHRKKRVKNDGRGYVSLPSPPGTFRIDYSQSMEDNPAPQEEKFDFILAFIYMEEKNRISFDYWCTTENSQLEVVFEYKENKFFLRAYGAIDNIPDNWEAEKIGVKKRNGRK